ncbi:bioA [Symbiodinium necroappetens]|uniref:BioA protein n=1 Tax=Symbiodinium necroappetens TaxID=1628268 RepID=A0A812XMU6_9DINO|nr:bioA [Symbiodinium necroappetens]
MQAKEPRNPAMLCGRGAAALELGRKDEAAADFRKALALNPKDSFARWALNSIGADPGLVQDGSAQRRPADASRSARPQTQPSAGRNTAKPVTYGVVASPISPDCVDSDSDDGSPPHHVDQEAPVPTLRNTPETPSAELTLALSVSKPKAPPQPPPRDASSAKEAELVPMTPPPPKAMQSLDGPAIAAIVTSQAVPSAPPVPVATPETPPTTPTLIQDRPAVPAKMPVQAVPPETPEVRTPETPAATPASTNAHADAPESPKLSHQEVAARFVSAFSEPAEWPDYLPDSMKVPQSEAPALPEQAVETLQKAVPRAKKRPAEPVPPVPPVPPAPKQPTAGAEHSSWVCQNVEAEAKDEAKAKVAEAAGLVPPFGFFAAHSAAEAKSNPQAKGKAKAKAKEGPTAKEAAKAKAKAKAKADAKAKGKAKAKAKAKAAAAVHEDRSEQLSTVFLLVYFLVCY